MTGDETAIREAAYFNWLEAGEPCCDGLQFWLEAQRTHPISNQQAAMDASIDEAARESFPASDPPALKAKQPIPFQQKRRV